MGKSAPSAPDPYSTAQAQGQMNQETARTQSKLNNPNTYGPTGAIEHVWGPDDTSSVYTYLSPSQQHIFDQQEAVTDHASGAALDATDRMRALLGSNVDTSNLTDYGWNAGQDYSAGVTHGVSGAGDGIAHSIGGAGENLLYDIPGTTAGIHQDFNAGTPMARMSSDDYGAQRDEVSNALLSRLEPQFDRDRTAQDAKLAAQGFTVGSQGYHDAADELNRSRTDARMQAILAGGQEQSRLAGLDAQRVTTDNAAAQAETDNINRAFSADNAGQAQSFGQMAQDRAFWNQAQQQAFTQRAQDAAFGNAAQDQGFQQNLSAAGFGNQAAAQEQNMHAAAVSSGDQQRAQQLAEMLQLRAQPINEVSALFGLGNGVSVPTQAQTSPVQVGAPDYQGLVSSNYKQAAQNASSSNATTAGAVGTIATAAAIAI